MSTRGWISRWRSLAEPALVVLTVGALASGGIAWLAGWHEVADWCWIAGTLVALVPAVLWVLAALRRGRAGVDVIAVLSLVGTLLVGEYIAGALIAVMLAGGRALEAAAERRASHDLRALLERAPRFARRRVGAEVSVIPVADVTAEDLLVVGPGEVVPVDGRIVDAVAVLDESVLTGEPLQVERTAGEPVRSGVVNAGTAFEMRATATAQDSTYAGIVRLAEQAGAESAPIVRLADRYAAWFVPLALADRGRGVAGERIGCTGSRGPGGGDTVSVVARRAGGDRLGTVARVTPGRGDSQRRRIGKPWGRNDSGDGQDRHPYYGAAGRGRSVGRTRTRRHRDIAARGVCGPNVAARACRGHRHRSTDPRALAVAADRRGRRTGPGRHRDA